MSDGRSFMIGLGKARRFEANRLYGLREVAGILGVSKPMIRELARTAGFPRGICARGQRKFSGPAIAAWIRERERSVQ